jgi:hypothetical protein
MRKTVFKSLFRLAGIALVTAGAIALPAKAVDTITFNPMTVTTKTVNKNPSQDFAVDMESLASTISSDPEYAVRFLGISSAPGTGLFNGVTGINRVDTNANVFLVDYNDPSQGSGIANSFTRDLNATVSPFFLTGTCFVCGMSNIISVSSLASGDVLGTFAGLSSGGIPTSGLYSIFTNNPIAFTFLGAGIAGTLSYEAMSSFTGSSTTGTSGSFTITAVPGPVPIAGAALAFSWSRKLRKRIKLAEPIAA